MRRGSRVAGPLVAVVMLTGACSGEPPEVAAPVTTLSTTGTTVTSTVPSTTTTPPTTTTTTTTLVIPDGIPEEAFARVGAPYPEFDTTFPDGFDAEAWLRAYEEWNRWAYANPVDGLETLDLWIVRGSALHSSLGDQLVGLAESNQLVVDDSDLRIIQVLPPRTEDGLIEFELLSQATGRVWIVERAEVVTSEDFGGTPVRSSTLILNREEGTWKLASWE